MLSLIQMFQKDLKNHDPTIKKLNKAVNDMYEQSGGKAGNLRDKCEEMNELFKDVQVRLLVDMVLSGDKIMTTESIIHKLYKFVMF